MRYKSITTPSVEHDAPNFLVEVYLLNRYGLMEEYCWRKGHSKATEWSFLLPLFKKLLKTHHIDPEQLAWFLHYHTPQSINQDTIGLFVFHIKRIKKLFKRIPLDKLQRLYTDQFADKDRGFMAVSDKDSYNGKAEIRADDLLSVLERLENG